VPSTTRSNRPACWSTASAGGRSIRRRGSQKSGIVTLAPVSCAAAGAGSTGASPLFSKKKRHRDLHPSLKYVPREREVEISLRELAKIS